MVNKEKYKLKKYIIILLTFCLVALILFSVLIYKEKSQIKRFDASNTKQAEEIKVKIDSIQDSDFFLINGYAYIEGKTIQTVDGFVVLYCLNTGSYYKLNTQLVSRPDVTETIGDGTDYSNSGFLARVAKSGLDFNNNGYEICYYYNHDNNNALAHSGVYMGNVSEGNHE